ncbi:MoaD/ThiS family protein [Hyphobacterium sp.]|uniref:MoaD/ThiS family protein n=1 Tax=Hyphobacterium sp. TaxID=2004662 RepID=UPI003BA9547F
MRIELKFYGPIQDRMGGAGRSVQIAEPPATLADLIQQLAQTFEDSAILQADYLRIAVNDQLVSRHDRLDLADGDRIAFLSPFSGG